MRIDSEYPYRAFWRMFVPGDTVYAAGWREGVFYKGGWVDDMNYPAGQFQLEVKHDGLFGRFLVRAGSLWGRTMGSGVISGGAWAVMAQPVRQPRVRPKRFLKPAPTGLTFSASWFVPTRSRPTTTAGSGLR